MEKVRYIWSQKQSDEKVLTVIASFSSISIIIFVGMQILGIKIEINESDPLLGVIMLIQAIQNWKKSRVVAILSLCAAILSLLGGLL